jgi:hypothetical protein
MKGHMYIPIKWTRRKNNTWFSDNLSVSLTQSYRIQYHKGAYKDYLYTVDTLEVGNGVDTPAEMYNHRGYGKTLKKAQELANEIEYIRQFQIRQEALRKINDLDWERVNK